MLPCCVNGLSETQHSCSLRGFGKITSESSLPFTLGFCAGCVLVTHRRACCASQCPGIGFPSSGRFGKALGSLWCSPAPPAAVPTPAAAGAEQQLCFLSHPLPAESHQFIYRSTATGRNFLPNSAEEIFTFRCPIPFPSQVSMLGSFETALKHSRVQAPPHSAQPISDL